VCVIRPDRVGGLNGILAICGSIYVRTWFLQGKCELRTCSIMKFASAGHWNMCASSFAKRPDARFHCPMDGRDHLKLDTAFAVYCAAIVGTVVSAKLA
jgi:hypothetical protein